MKRIHASLTVQRTDSSITINIGSWTRAGTMVDVLLQTAVANWEPRFCSNGVDASDYSRITKDLERWDDWCAAWCKGAEVHLELAKAALAKGNLRTAGEFYARAATYFHFGKFLFVHDLDQAKAAHARAVDALNKATPLFVPPARREEIAFEGSTLVALFRVPDTNGPHPTVILIPGLDSTKEEFREVERAFLDRGMATFALDGPGQGEAEWTLAIRPEWDQVGEAVFNHLRVMADVDSSRLGVWGVSLGGFYAARMASSDLPIKGTISLAGPYNLGAAWKNLNPLTRHAFQVRSFCSTPEEAEQRAGDMTLEGHAKKITTPMLVIMGKRDRLFPWQDSERLASEVRGESELLLLEEGNHGCANVICRHRPQSADWMAERLQVSSVAAPTPRPQEM
ncbi:MAG TPA: alpha/beta fold hydrolase [Acidimicrobiales bacterium]|nr:alpha/beta fold hydrolase [Acidimicrobiales bacterium]